MSEDEPRTSQTGTSPLEHWLETALKCVGILAGISALLYGVIFLEGWLYLASFFESFKIDLWALDIPAYQIPPMAIFAIRDFRSLGVFLLASAVLIVVVWFVRRKWPQPETDRAPGRFERLLADFARSFAMKAVLFVAVAYSAVTIYVLFLFLPITEGKRSASLALTRGSHVRLGFKLGAKQAFDPELIIANDSNKLYLLTQTKDLVVVFEPQAASKRDIFFLLRTDLVSRPI